MPPARRQSISTPDPYRIEIHRRVAARAPLGFGVFLTCVAISTLFEVVHFPERVFWMGAFAAGFALLAGASWWIIRRRPAWTIPTLVTFVNVVGVAINVYHAIVHASLAMCVWVLTALLGTAAVILPWGIANQALASIGVLFSYPLHLYLHVADPLTWGAGGTYLLILVVLSVFGASLFASSVRNTLRLRAALSEREARLQSYFDLLLVGTGILSGDGSFIEVNDELCRMFGYTRAELFNLSWRALLHPHDRAAVGALLRRTLGGGRPERREMRCLRKDGTTIQGIVSMRGLPGSQGVIDHVMLLVQDVTEQRRVEVERERYLVRAEAARQQAEEANRAKDEFLATVSHELRTPLTPILAWSKMLQRGGLDDEKKSTALTAIEHGAKTQAQLIDDLLDVSRIVSGEWRLTLRPLELGPIVRAATDVVRPAAEAKGLEFEVLESADDVPVLGDPERLQQVVTNLLSNAIKFTPPEGRVTVVLERAGSSARLVVRDTGEGIEPGFLSHVFERFRQAEGSITRRHGGLGLGLAIVRTLVELHGGTVYADSPGKGHGASFTVELPLATGIVAVAPPVVADRQNALRASLGGLHVLVVDDDPGSNAVVSALLASCGGEVRTAESAPEALEIAGRWQPDVLVSDLAMPGEDGFALLRKLRARKGPLGEVPAIALTAHAGAADRLRSLAAGFQAHIAKPFDPAELAAAVEEAAARIRPPAA
jgi:PAS domain S-box-containing protein